MSKEKQTDQDMKFNETVSEDDVEMLREVLESSFSRNIMPVSIYEQGDFDEAP